MDDILSLQREVCSLEIDLAAEKMLARGYRYLLLHGEVDPGLCKRPHVSKAFVDQDVQRLRTLHLALGTRLAKQKRSTKELQQQVQDFAEGKHLVSVGSERSKREAAVRDFKFERD